MINIISAETPSVKNEIDTQSISYFRKSSKNVDFMLNKTPLLNKADENISSVEY